MKAVATGQTNPARHHCFILHPSAFILFFLTGCASYEYDVLEPAEMAGHVGTKSYLSARRDDLEYRFITSDNRLVMFVYNRGERLVKLSGPDSAAVDAAGESHPLQSGTLPPGSHLKRIFPPPPPTVQHTGPTFGFGAGYAVNGFHHAHDPFYYGGFHDYEPRYYSVYDPNNRVYFDWPGGTQLHLMLAYEVEGAQRLRHEFVFVKRQA